jgi:hypothetical protein
MTCAPTSAKKCVPGLREGDHYEPLSRGWTRLMTTDAEIYSTGNSEDAASVTEVEQLQQVT